MAEPRIEPRRKGPNATQTMLLPAIDMVAEAIAAVPPGTVADLAHVRTTLAAQYGADACCPVTVQRHVRTLAEEAAANPANAVPYWRVIDPDRPTAGRLAGGVEAIRARRSAEQAVR
ncbi:MAG: hypothetical protein ABI414_06925 [Devosia sp.]